MLESEIDNNIGKGEQEIAGGENLNVVIALPNEKINNIYSLYASTKIFHHANHVPIGIYLN